MFRSVTLLFVMPGLAAAHLASRLARLESVFESGSEISDFPPGLIDNLKKMVEDELFPEINQTHARDMSLLQSHAKSLGDCNTGLRRTGKVCLTMNASVRSKETQLNACYNAEGDLKSAYQAANRSITEFLENAAPPTSSLPSLVAGPSVEGYVFDALNFWTGFKNTYSDMKARLSNASYAYSTKSSNCSAQKAGFETSYCNLKLEISNAQIVYGTCRSAMETLYNQTLLSSINNANERKADYKAILRIKCLMKTLLSGQNDSAGKLADCQSQVVDDSFLDIVEPQLPPFLTAYLTSLALPAGGPACDDNDDTTTSTTTTTVYNA